MMVINPSINKKLFRTLRITRAVVNQLKELKTKGRKTDYDQTVPNHASPGNAV